VVAQCPQDGRGWIGIDLSVAAVDVQCDHAGLRDGIRAAWTGRMGNCCMMASC
jgi:hypothetical protein